MIGLSVIVAIVSAVLGIWARLVVPSWFGYQSTTTAGMMAVAAGGLLLAADSVRAPSWHPCQVVRRPAIEFAYSCR